MVSAYFGEKQAWSAELMFEHLHRRNCSVQFVGFLDILRVTEFARESLETVVVVVEQSIAGEIAAFVLLLVELQWSSERARCLKIE